MRGVFVALVVVLAVGCKDPAPPSDAAPKTFKAPRPAAKPVKETPPEAAEEPTDDTPSGAAPGEESGPPDEVIEAVLGVLEGMRDGKKSSAHRGAYAATLARAMGDNSYCLPDRREPVAEAIVTAIGDADATRSLSGVKPEQMWRLAEAFSRDMAIRCGGEIPREGTITVLPKFKPPDGYAAMTWKTLKGYDFKAGKPLPANVTALHGEKVAINGYMIPLATKEKTREFVLVGALWDCCFGKPPKINHGVVVTIAKGTNYSDFPILVFGTMEVGEELEDGEVISVYRLRADGVQGQTL